MPDASRHRSLDNLEAKSSAAVAALGAAFPSLTTLHVMHSHKMSASALAALATLCPALRELCLDDTLTLPAPALATLPSFAHLTSLSLRYCALSPGWSLTGCTSLSSCSLAGALDSEDPDEPLRLAGALPASLRRLDVSLMRSAPRELQTWLAEPGRLLAAFGTVDAAGAGGPFPAASASPSSSPRYGRTVCDLDMLAVAAETGPDSCWLHGVLTHAVWAFLSLREAEDGAPPPPPPGPFEPQLRASSADVVASGVLLSRSPHAEVVECAAGMLSSLANCPAHMGAMLRGGGFLALLRLTASPHSELVAELASEGVRNLSYQAARAAEDEEPDQPERRELLLSPHVLDALVANWRTGPPRMRHYAALTLSDICRMTVHLAPDSSPKQVGALTGLLNAGAVPVFVQLASASDVGDQYAGSRPLAILSFVGRSGVEPCVPADWILQSACFVLTCARYSFCLCRFFFGNHERATTNIAAMVAAGAVEPLIALIGADHDHDIRAEAVSVIRNACFANTATASAFASADAAAVLTELASSTSAELLNNSAVESAVTALCNLCCVSDDTAACVARSGAPEVLARFAADESAAMASMRWVATVALCGLEAHGAVPRTTAVSSLLKLTRGVGADGSWLVGDRKTLVMQVILQLAWCTDDEATWVAVCRALAKLATDAAAAQLLRQEGGRDVLRRLSSRHPSRALRLEAERAAAALSIVIGDTAPRASPRLRRHSGGVN